MSSATPFDFVSGYFTSGWGGNVTVVFKGYLGDVLKGTATHTMTTTSPSLVEFDSTFSGIDMVLFDTSGSGGWVVMDNMTVNVPEPATLVLLGMAGLSLLGYAWRRRRS
jgi:hypothetical protein